MGTIIVTGANGSLAIPTVKLLLSNYPDFTTVLTVRNTLDSDVNTKRLREVVAQHPGAKSSIRKLDLTSLPGVHEFASTIAAEIADGKLSPLASIVCNAYHWNLVGKAERTEDAYDKTFQVTHVAHVALVLRLLGSFGPNGGRIVLFSSDAHWPGKNGLEKYPPAIPNDMDLLAKPEAHVPSDNFGRGFQRYANSKLAVVMWTYALNRYLEKDQKLESITAVAIDPGKLSDSRALRTNTPSMLYWLSILIIKPLRPLLSFTDPTMRTVSKAAAAVASLATNTAYPKQRGYFTLLKEDSSSPDSMNEEMQQKLWVKSMEWAKITRENTALSNSFE